MQRFNFNSLMEVFDWLEQKGYTEEFHIDNGGVRHSESSRYFPAKAINIIQTIKLEETSDPDYTSLVFVVEIEGTDLKGFFVDATGSYADLKLSSLHKA